MNYADILKEVNRAIPEDIAARFKDDALFTAYGCVLLEKRISGHDYAYKAINLQTGHSTCLVHKREPLTLAGIPQMLKKIKASPAAGPGRFHVDMNSGNNLFHHRLIEIMNQIFYEILPGYGYGVREKQVELSQHMLEAIARRSIALDEAEVGTGKTHAYLIAAALAKRGRINDFWLRGSYPGQAWGTSANMPVVIATSSIALQNAIVKDYIPQISQMLMDHEIIKQPLTCVLRKGKEHYICDKNLLSFYRDASEPMQEAIRPLLTSRSPDIANAAGLTPYVKRKICVSGRCDKHCPRIDRCRFQQHMDHAQSDQYDFQVCNHNYFLADLLQRAASSRRPLIIDEKNGRGAVISRLNQRPGSGPRKSTLIPHYQAAIIDEGHKFIEAARQMYGVQLESDAIYKVTDSIFTFVYEEGYSGQEHINELARKLAKQNKALFQRLHQNIPACDEDEETERFSTVIDADAVRHLRNIQHISVELSDALRNSQPTEHYAGRCSQAQWMLGKIAEKAETLRNPHELVYWLEKPPGDVQVKTTLCAIPKDLGHKLYADLWSKGIPAILTSGTLSASGDFTHTKRTLGLDTLPPKRLMETTKPSPFDHRNNILLYISETVPFPDTQDPYYIEETANEIEQLIRASNGHAVVLFTSYKAMDKVFSLLEARNLPYPMLRMGRGRNAAIDQFRESKKGVLFASGALWEGIDLPGDILSMLIIVKLPFAVPDPISEYEKTLYANLDEYKNRVVVPEMIIKLKQGFGRLIRTEQDTGVVALLDYRARMGKPYRARVLDALPDCRTTSRLADVQQFYKTKKGHDYFV